MSPADAFPQARVAVRRALEIDDTLAEAHASLGHIMFQYDRDWSGAEKEFRRAIELNPHYAYAHQWYALSLMWVGRLDEALHEIRQARAIGPLSLVINSNLGFILAVAHQYDQASSSVARRSRWTRVSRMRYRLDRFRLKDESGWVVEEGDRAFRDSPAPLPNSRSRMHARRQDARGEIAGRIAGPGSRLRYVSPFDVALIYAGLGDNRQAIDWLEMASKERAPSLNFLTLSPAFDGCA
jgi:tetratricopeptide (TPR) repeat protein